MPPLSVFFVRSALLHLTIGFSIGALMLANKGINFSPWLWRLRGAHTELLLVGWLIQLALGVAFWIAPRFWEKPVRGNVTGARWAFGLLNLGVWLVALSAFTPFPGALTLAGRILEVSAGAAFAWHLWPRIVSREG